MAHQLCTNNTQIYVGIIPIAGNASRMRGLPKFLLPAKNNMTLLDNAVSVFKRNNICDLYAGLSESNDYLLQNNTDFNKIVVKTKTMTETVKQITQITDSENVETHRLILIMPDTYFNVTNEINLVKQYLDDYKIVLVCWKIKDYQIGKVGQCKIVNNEVIDIIDKDKDCSYPHFWGIISWNSTLNRIINPEWQTIGDLVREAIKNGIAVRAIVSDSDYYDCGTFDEYFQMIKTVL